ncbi:hypothetical protein MTO96_046423, partial [Rhipicephalus appendiculatus]
AGADTADQQRQLWVAGDQLLLLPWQASGRRHPLQARHTPAR